MITLEANHLVALAILASLAAWIRYRRPIEAVFVHVEERIEQALTPTLVYLSAAVDRARPNLRGVASQLGSDWRAKFEDRRPRHRQPVSRWAAVKSR